MARQDMTRMNAFALAGSGFVVGVAAGLLLKDAGRQMYERARTALWHREYERTITYDENLPESLARREPAPHPGQPRYGGTGALGVSPATVQTTPQETNKREGI